MTIKNKKEFSVLITAAGNSSRMKDTKKKEYLQLPNALMGVTVLSENIYKFLSTNLFVNIIITIPKNDLTVIEKIIFQDPRIQPLLRNSETKLFFEIGGATRQESVFNGLKKLNQLNGKQNSKFVLIHDGARPWLSKNLIEQVCLKTKNNGSAIPAINAIDTQKIVDESGIISQHLRRSKVFSVQTPQGFNFFKLWEAHNLAKTNIEYTDDSEIYALVEKNIFICEGEITNKKITYKTDIEEI